VHNLCCRLPRRAQRSIVRGEAPIQSEWPYDPICCDRPVRPCGHVPKRAKNAVRRRLKPCSARYSALGISSDFSRHASFCKALLMYIARSRSKLADSAGIGSAPVRHFDTVEGSRANSRATAAVPPSASNKSPRPSVFEERRCPNCPNLTLPPDYRAPNLRARMLCEISSRGKIRIRRDDRRHQITRVRRRKHTLLPSNKQLNGR